MLFFLKLKLPRLSIHGLDTDGRWSRRVGKRSEDVLLPAAGPTIYVITDGN